MADEIDKMKDWGSEWEKKEADRVALYRRQVVASEVIAQTEQERVRVTNAQEERRLETYGNDVKSVIEHREKLEHHNEQIRLLCHEQNIHLKRIAEALEKATRPQF